VSTSFGSSSGSITSTGGGFSTGGATLIGAFFGGGAAFVSLPPLPEARNARKKSKQALSRIRERCLLLFFERLI